MATLLAVSRDYVYDLINSGQLRVADVGSSARVKKRIRADDLQAFIESRTT
ncbi:helix-turn-helix domain-containing protein [Psychromicrobium lacuslunae]|uniref:helix-turn-helix domain-containing protein n=1 Tax=Psychromicrobium lacuslunae TaxID=1618207 RepID=UPI003BF5875F